VPIVDPADEVQSEEGVAATAENPQQQARAAEEEAISQTAISINLHGERREE
jgi:hypothetical protein